jgi:hypothetical protein
MPFGLYCSLVSKYLFSNFPYNDEKDFFPDWNMKSAFNLKLHASTCAKISQEYQARERNVLYSEKRNKNQNSSTNS